MCLPIPREGEHQSEELKSSARPIDFSTQLDSLAFSQEAL